MYPFLPIIATPTVALPPRALSPNPPSHSYSASVYDLPECRALLWQLSVFISLSLSFPDLAAANRQRFTTSPAGLEIPDITEIPAVPDEPEVS